MSPLQRTIGLRIVLKKSYTSTLEQYRISELSIGWIFLWGNKTLEELKSNPKAEPTSLEKADVSFNINLGGNFFRVTLKIV